ncbi:MAG: hypothetical protein R3C01_00595 [Planctomycetaceae bacterium]
MKSSQDQSELLLQAFRFAAGEMSAVEAEGFELRLATDLAACEALADAVLLMQSLARQRGVQGSRPSETVAPKVAVGAGYRPHWSSAVRVGLALGTLGLLVLIAVALVTSDRWVASLETPKLAASSTDDQVEHHQYSATAVAEQWTLLNDLNDDDVESYGGDETSRLAESTSEVDVPDWMLAALAVTSNQPSRSEELSPRSTNAAELDAEEDL